MSEGAYLLYIWKPDGYELGEREGEVPPVGTELEVDGLRLVVGKVASSPLPNDPRLCAFLLPA